MVLIEDGREKERSDEHPSKANSPRVESSETAVNVTLER
jgi:hypothetical protein